MSGLTFNVKSTLKESEIKSDIESKIHKQQKYFDALVLQDSNYFIPIKTGTMEKSSQINTRLGTGEIVWRTPYVRRQYYDYHKSPYQKNPNACGKWFEAAKARWIEKWVRFVNERIKRS